MAKLIAHYEMTLKGQAFSVKEGDCLTFYDRYTDLHDAVIQINSLEDAANVEIMAGLMKDQFWWKLTQGEIYDIEPISVPEFSKRYCNPRYTVDTYVPIGETPDPSKLQIDIVT